VPAGSLNPNEIHLPGIYVKKILQGKSYKKPIEVRSGSVIVDCVRLHLTVSCL